VSVPTPTVSGWGFFVRVASRAVWHSPPSSQVGQEEQGKHAVVPPSVRHTLAATVNHVYRDARPCAGAPVHAGVVAWVAIRRACLVSALRVEVNPCGALCTIGVSHVASVDGASRMRHRRAEALACATRARTVN
jgi:hypothetical protein